MINETITMKTVNECNKIYQQKILQPIGQYCKEANDLDLIRNVLEPRPKRQIDIIVKGIKLAYDNWGKILHVRQSVMGFASNWINSKRMKKLTETSLKNSKLLTITLQQQERIR